MGQGLTIIISGIAATGAMTGFLYIVNYLGIANADMLRAIGSFVRPKADRPFQRGLAIQIVSGLFFAAVYSFILSIFPADDFFEVVIVCMSLGFFHGLIVGLGLMIVVAQFHPKKEFRKAGPAVAVAHMLAHVVYGVTLGVGLASFGFDPNFILI